MSSNTAGLPGLEAIKRWAGWDNIAEKNAKVDFIPSLIFSLSPEKKGGFPIEINFNRDQKYLWSIKLGEELPVFMGYPIDPWRNMIEGLKVVRSLVKGQACLYYMLDRNGEGRPNAFSAHLLTADELPSPLQAGYSDEYEDPEGIWPSFNGRHYSLPPFRRAFFNRPDIVENLDPQRYRPYRYGWLLSGQFEQALALEEKLKMPLKDRLCGGRYYEDRDDEDDD